MIKCLYENLKLTVTVKIGYCRSSRCAISVSVVTRIGQRSSTAR